MKNKKRHISNELKYLIAMIIAIIIFVCSLFIYNNYMVGRSIVNNIPLTVFAVIVIIVVPASFCSIFVFGSCLLYIIISKHEAKVSLSKAEKQIKKLSNKFVDVHFKDFENFPLANFISSEDISCKAKRYEDGTVIYLFELKAKFYETDDYELFMRHFDV